MMYNELLHSFIVMYRLHDTLKKDHLHVYLTEKSFTSMPSWSSFEDFTKICKPCVYV